VSGEKASSAKLQSPNFRKIKSPHARPTLFFCFFIPKMSRRSAGAQLSGIRQCVYCLVANKCTQVPILNEENELQHWIHVDCADMIIANFHPHVTQHVKLYEFETAMMFQEDMESVEEIAKQARLEEEANDFYAPPKNPNYNKKVAVQSWHDVYEEKAKKEQENRLVHKLESMEPLDLLAFVAVAASQLE